MENFEDAVDFQRSLHSIPYAQRLHYYEQQAPLAHLWPKLSQDHFYSQYAYVLGELKESDQLFDLCKAITTEEYRIDKDAVFRLMMSLVESGATSDQIQEFSEHWQAAYDTSLKREFDNLYQVLNVITALILAKSAYDPKASKQDLRNFMTWMIPMQGAYLVRKVAPGLLKSKVDRLRMLAQLWSGRYTKKH